MNVLRAFFHGVHVAALDAPIVAVVWQQAFARAFGVSLGSGERVILFVSVWLAYMADRFVDALRVDPSRLGTDRHRFARRHARVLVVVWSVTTAAAVAGAFVVLSPASWAAGWVLFAAVAVHLLLAQIRQLGSIRFPKELGVGAVFAAGCAVFVVAEGYVAAAGGSSFGPRGFLAAGSVIAFAVLATLDCLAIGVREDSLDRQRGEWRRRSPAELSRLVTFGARGLAAGSFLIALGASVFGGPDLGRAVEPWWAVAIASVGLLALHRWARGGEDAAARLRDVSDWVLLSPPIVWFSTL